MILRFGLKNIDFLGKMKAEKFALLIHQRTRGGYVPNRERNHFWLVNKSAKHLAEGCDDMTDQKFITQQRRISKRCDIFWEIRCF